MRDVQTSKDFSLKLKHQSEAKIEDQIFLNILFVEKNPNTVVCKKFATMCKKKMPPAQKNATLGENSKIFMI